MAKEFLSQHSIPFDEKNISTDDDALAELTKRNIRSVPTFLVGNEVVVGFDKNRLLTSVIKTDN